MLPVLSACVAPQDPVDYLKQWNVQSHSSAGFDYCKGYGCRLIDHVEIDKKSWKKIDNYFKTPSKTAQSERDRLKLVIGEFERIVGPITGTDTDVKDTFYALGDDQLDCVDESVNTTTFLLILQERGHIKFHEIEQPTARPILLAGNRWPHQAAVIRDKKTQTRYVVDSWFEDSGEDAYVVEVKEWTYGWSPKKAKKKQALLEKQRFEKEKEVSSRIITPIN